jgi:beta-galactosidase
MKPTPILRPLAFVGAILAAIPARAAESPAAPVVAPPEPFLQQLYDSLHDTPAQRRFRALAPMPAGVVYVQQPGEGEAEMRAHFRQMRALGFNALKQIMPLPTWTVEQIQLVALEEGIIPWWYGEGGYEPVTPELRSRLGLPAELPMAEVLRHPEWVRYQHGVLRRRIERTSEFVRQSPTGRFLRTGSVAFDPEVGGRGRELSEHGGQLFLEWLRGTYGTVEKLNDAWNQNHAGLFLGETRTFRSWEDVAANWKDLTKREYRNSRDILRFKADHSLGRIRGFARELAAFDPFYPFRGGGELGLFLPSAWYAVDLEGIAGAVAEHGSFYPSMHFSWHFDQVNHEITRPLYMQAALMADLFKGGWTGGWESTGGPQQLDGERGNQTPNSYYVGAGELMQLYLSQMAGGFRGFGIWCWNARSAGKEAGEYSLLDRNGAVTDRAVRIGQLGQAMQRHRFELWQARKEPLVGVLFDWENEAVWAAMSFVGRESFRVKPVEARVGVSRALINGNVPFEYVTPTDLRRGLAGRYRVIYLPAMLALQKDVLEILARYVADGGRLVLDLPGAWYDEWTRLFPTGNGSKFAQVFGATLDDFQYSGVNRALRIGDHRLDGFVAALTATTARVMEKYDDGRPAITEHNYGRGAAVILGWEASGNCHRPGNVAGETLLRRHALGVLAAPYSCAEAIVYRLATPAADHYFFINDGPARPATLLTGVWRYGRHTDAVTGAELKRGAPIELGAHDARWIRCEK